MKVVGNKDGAKASDSPPRLFKNQDAWESWLEKNHSKSTGIWLRLAKKGSTLKSISRVDALESALCYGWIDGQARPENERTWLQRFVPRSRRSIWSKINREKVENLINRGRVKPAGLRAIEDAKNCGRWDAAYDSPSRSAVPDDFQAALTTNPRANEFFQTLDRANRYAILFRIQTVKKAETRARKIREFIAMLARHEKIHR
jgi:uncharacterized protein YdeI (YjbR/CyaY-like superfamily)